MYVQLKNNVSFRKTFQVVGNSKYLEKCSRTCAWAQTISQLTLLHITHTPVVVQPYWHCPIEYFFTFIYKHKINSEKKIEENKLRLTLIFSWLSDHFSCKGQRQRIRFSAWLHASTFFFHHNTKLHRVLQCILTSLIWCTCIHVCMITLVEGVQRIQISTLLANIQWKWKHFKKNHTIFWRLFKQHQVII